MADNFSYLFPAIRGIQAGREYYVSMCPLRLLSKIFVFDDEELVPELRAQRTLNRSRIPEMSRYIVNNKDDYTFSAITASIDGQVQFDAQGEHNVTTLRMGTLKVSMDAKFVVNDGQHRQAAIKGALQIAPELGEETIAVVFFIDRGLERSQQMFADLNRYAVRPSASIGVLYEHRNAAANVAKHLSLTSKVFQNLIETERSSLSPRSRKLFTLSALYFSILEMLTEKELEDFSSATKKCHAFWEEVGKQIPEWNQVRISAITSGDVRRDFIHSHAIVLQALGRVGKAIYDLPAPNLSRTLAKLKNIDWSRQNASTWEGRAMVGGAMAKSAQNVTLTAIEIKKALGLKLSSDEQAAEDALQAARVPTNKQRKSDK
ncbi:DNA sulfur modification protein DndB [Pseudoduganella sp. FT25W]|uniref:DNA sulfur modification protein DndB n=1 Tax=Duganella alba TaxID=2666081 RepID=A0A6L5QEV5_9BURK|nr:DNA sulfur modification protein DndB [Duganella alba]MRX08140.1 DNA sulfur modification protein DndB [Duganella alba]MRX16323.1 DNA sulfur modification protein DndB [Duganella alba]